MLTAPPVTHSVEMSEKTHLSEGDCPVIEHDTTPVNDTAALDAILKCERVTEMNSTEPASAVMTGCVGSRRRGGRKKREERRRGRREERSEEKNKKRDRQTCLWRASEGDV